jgi:hypothetical protein
MLRQKACHVGLRPKSQLFGLEPIDGLMLFVPLYVCTALLHRIVLGVAVTVLLAVVIRVLKWGRLPGYSSALLAFLTLPAHTPVLGRERAPHYPATRRGGA